MRRIPHLTGLLALLACVAAAPAEPAGGGDDEIPAKIRQCFARGEEERQAKEADLSVYLREAQDRLKLMRQAKIGQFTREPEPVPPVVGGPNVRKLKGTYEFQSRAEREEAIRKQVDEVKELEARRRDLDKSKGVAVPTVPLNPDIGTIGKLEYPRFRVLQVIGDRDALIQRLAREFPEPIWLKGISTAGWVDGNQVTVDQTIEVTGTRKYQATSGAGKTVLVFEAIDLRPYQEAILKKQREGKKSDAAKAPPAKAPPAPIRR